MRRTSPRHGEVAKRRKRREETIELADPVHETITACVGNQDVASSTTESAILDIDVDGVGRPVVAASGVMIVIGVQQVRAETAKQLVVIRPADQPVVPKVTEQDVFVERIRGSGQVFRVGKAEAARFADAPIYRAATAVRHAPFSPDRNGPYPKGASLGMSLGDWLAATGRVSYTSSRGVGRVRGTFKDLVPYGTYTMWYLRFAKAHMGCADCPFATIDFPLGAKDGSQSSFIADAQGGAVFDAAFKPCLKLGDDQLGAALAIAYHSDGNTHGPSPGDMGHAVGRRLREHELRVITCLTGRSGRTRALADSRRLATLVK